MCLDKINLDKTVCFMETYGHFQTCLWQPNQVFQAKNVCFQPPLCQTSIDLSLNLSVP